MNQAHSDLGLPRSISLLRKAKLVLHWPFKILTCRCEKHAQTLPVLAVHLSAEPAAVAIIYRSVYFCSRLDPIGAARSEQP